MQRCGTDCLPNDALELYRYWSTNVPHHPERAQGDHEHNAILGAALGRDPDRAVALLTEHLEATARHLASIAPDDAGAPPEHIAVAD